jgi:hypothetical protein
MPPHGFPVYKKKDKKPYTLFVFQNHGDRKCCSLAFHSYKEPAFFAVQGVWMLRSFDSGRTHPVLHGTILFSVEAKKVFRENYKNCHTDSIFLRKIKKIREAVCPRKYF